ncbi:MAG: energy transducer TonB [Vicinamibacterales bacterium]
MPRRSAARLLTGPAPEYPVALRTARIGGTVQVRFTIDSSGRVINVQSLTGPAQLRAAAEAAVKRWRYEAARIDNLAVETETSVRFNFDPSTAHRPQE